VRRQSRPRLDARPAVTADSFQQLTATANELTRADVRGSSVLEAEVTLDGREHPAPGSGGPAVVVLPAEIDFANAGSVGQELTAALASGASLVIADLSATTFCDSPGARTLMQAHNLAADRHIDLRFAVTSSAVRRVFEIMNFDRLLRIYPSLHAALTAGAALEGDQSG
jgi:anti-sigma B factor antagonist